MKNDYADIQTAAKLLGYTEQHVRRLCVTGKLPGACKKGGVWQVPVTADIRLRGFGERYVNASELLDVPERKRREAYRRLGIVEEFQRFASAYLNSGGEHRKQKKRSDALAVYAAQNGIGKRTLERWIAIEREQGIGGLIDSRGGNKFTHEILSPDAWELFKSMYLTQQQLSAKLCWQNINYINKTESRGWVIPSLQYIYKHIEQQIPLYVRVLHREGMAAYEAKCAPYVQLDPDAVEPGSVWIGDHHQFNCWVRYRNQWVRPWLTAWEDMRSRTLVGWYVTASPNQTTIMQAFKRGIERFGPPDSVKIDNGRDYDSEMWTGTTKARRRALNAGYLDEPMVAGLYAMMDVGVSFSIPYHPQSKPVERYFDTLDRQFTKTVDTYCGKDSARKPENLNDYLKRESVIKNALSLEEFAALASEYIDTVYNRSAHTGRGMDGRAPLTVMGLRTSRRVISEGVIDLLLRVWSGEVLVGKNGVRFKNLWYGQFDTELLACQGKKVRLAYDPDDLRSVYVYDAATMRLVTIAEQNQLVRYGDPVSEENLREAMKQKARAVKVAREYKDSRLTANMDLTTLALKAQQSAAEIDSPNPNASMRPVATVLDSQVDRHKQLQTIKAVRKAAGAEGVKHTLEFDLSVLQKSKRKSIFNNE